MAQKLTRGEVQDLVSKFATENPKYRAAIIADPKGTIERQLNAPLGSTKVKAVADTADTYHIVVPYVATEGELSDAERAEYAAYARANKFIAILQRQARALIESRS